MRGNRAGASREPSHVDLAGGAKRCPAPLREILDLMSVALRHRAERGACWQAPQRRPRTNACRLAQKRCSHRPA